MREFLDLDEVLDFCKALSSPIRMEIIKILKENRMLNLNELATALNVTNGAITSHIKILDQAGLIEVEHSAGIRGIQKNCILKETKFLINLADEYSRNNTYQVELPVGSYNDFSVWPTCGLATKSQLIGEVDDKRYFDDPLRREAAILWFSKGHISYRIPNYLKPQSKIEELQVSFEISSEAPGICEDYPSDIQFYLNDVYLGYWTSPGDFGEVKGLYTPEWWFPNWNQYGLLKMITISKDGVYLDGRKISDVTIDSFHLDHESDLVFRFAVDEKSENVGGLTLFGKGFGNYNQDINARIIYY
ncbi:MAG: helix-turn-helix domain-containing protein [Epulopiscium sp.]|mgnify:CR=1 FL=1|nr:helix-turn-helix domain-containing protein [Candidatus Epulonipiscium sp.]